MVGGKKAVKHAHTSLVLFLFHISTSNAAWRQQLMFLCPFIFYFWEYKKIKTFLLAFSNQTCFLSNVFTSLFFKSFVLLCSEFLFFTFFFSILCWQLRWSQRLQQILELGKKKRCRDVCHSTVWIFHSAVSLQPSFRLKHVFVFHFVVKMDFKNTHFRFALEVWSCSLMQKKKKDPLRIVFWCWYVSIDKNEENVELWKRGKLWLDTSAIGNIRPFEERCPGWP